MAKKKNNKNKSKNKNKRNSSPAVAPKAKFSASSKGAVKNNAKAVSEKTKKAPEKKKIEKKTVATNKPIANLKSRKLIFIISAVVLALLIAAAVTIVVLLCNKVPDLAISEYNGQNATVSTASDITVDEETQLERYNEIKKKIKGDKNAFKFYARPSVEVDEKYKEGTIMFSNLTMNECVMIVTLMDEEDDIIFRSMGIAPGKCMQRISLTKTLSFGNHEVMMYVTAYDATTFEIIGTQYMKLDLMFGDEYSASEDVYSTTENITVNPDVTRPVEATSATRTTTKPASTQVATEVTTVNAEDSTDPEKTSKKENDDKSTTSNKTTVKKTTVKADATKKVVKAAKKAS